MKKIFNKYNYELISIQKKLYLKDIAQSTEKHSLSCPNIIIPMFVTFNNGLNLKKKILSNKKIINHIIFKRTTEDYIITTYTYQKKTLKLYSNIENGLRELFYMKEPKMMRSRTIGVNIRIEIFKRDKYTCQYCGWKNGTQKGDRVLHIDHKIPVYFGGTNNINNLVTACYRCNISKNNKVTEWENLEDFGK
jgi:hypothetical protein